MNLWHKDNHPVQQAKNQKLEYLAVKIDRYWRLPCHRYYENVQPKSCYPILLSMLAKLFALDLVSLSQWFHPMKSHNIPCHAAVSRHSRLVWDQLHLRKDSPPYKRHNHVREHYLLARLGKFQRIVLSFHRSSS